MDVNLSPPIYTIIGRAADTMGIRAFAVGGVVRDYFLQRPCTDIDVVCVGSGIELAEQSRLAMKEWSKQHPEDGDVGRLSVFKNFGTASFVFFYILKTMFYL